MNWPLFSKREFVYIPIPFFVLAPTQNPSVMFYMWNFAVLEIQILYVRLLYKTTAENCLRSKLCVCVYAAPWMFESVIFHCLKKAYGFSYFFQSCHAKRMKSSIIIQGNPLNFVYRKSQSVGRTMIYKKSLAELDIFAETPVKSFLELKKLCVVNQNHSCDYFDNRQILPRCHFHFYSTRGTRRVFTPVLSNLG